MLLLKWLPCLRPFCWSVALAVGLFTTLARAQVVPSGFDPVHALWVGGEYSNIHAGFPYQSNQRLWGVGAFADYHLSNRMDIEAETRFLRWNSFYGETEDNYLAGPRYLVERFGRIQPYGQCLVGFGILQYPFQIDNRRYFAIAPGAGVNIRISREWTLRGQYEYQFWPDSPNYTHEPKHEISPNGFHVGVAFRVFR
jgi:opacity protein-like surface antigen